MKTVNVDRPRQSFGERIYLGSIVQGLGVTIRHFLRNLFGQRGC